MFARIVEPPTQAADAVATELSLVGVALTLQHLGEQAQLRWRVSA